MTAIILARVAGWLGIVVAAMILFGSPHEDALWRAVIVAAVSSIVVVLPRDYRFSLKHFLGLGLLGLGFWYVYHDAQDRSALLAFGLIVVGGYFADILDRDGGNGSDAGPIGGSGSGSDCGGDGGD